MIVGIVIACLAGLGAVTVAVQSALQRWDTYSVDLAAGEGDFDIAANGRVTLAYEQDGYHATLLTSGWVVTGVVAPTAHSTLSAEVTVTALTAPAGAEFGTFVLEDQYGAGYAAAVDTAGTATLYRLEQDGSASVLATGTAPPLSAGTTRSVMLTCVIDGGTTHLGGYVDGRLAVSVDDESAIPDSTTTGLIGYSDTVPAEWVATHYARRSGGDLPADAPGR